MLDVIAILAVLVIVVWATWALIRKSSAIFLAAASLSAFLGALCGYVTIAGNGTDYLWVLWPWAGLTTIATVLFGVAVVWGSRPVRWIAIGLLGLTCLVGLSPAQRLILLSMRESQPFNNTAWRAQTVDHPVRSTMVDDLLKSYQLKSMTREEIIALLGEPTDTDKFSNFDLVYWLGPERSSYGGISIDSEWLVLALGVDHRVVSYEVIRD
jgi:hypothetical protein